MKTFLLLLFLLLTKISYSQYFDWAINPKPYIPFYSTFPLDLVIDDDSNFYICMGSNGIAKFDSDSNFLWQQDFNFFHPDKIKLKNNKLYLSGAYFDDHSQIKCLDTSGSPVWTRTILSGNIRDITIDGTNNVIVTGYFIKTATFDAGVNITVFGDYDFDNDAFLAKFNSNGNFLWVKHLHQSHNTTFEAGVSVVSDDDNNIYLSGYTTDTLFISGTSEIIAPSQFLYSDNIFLSKFNDNGNLIWGKVMGGNSLDKPRNLIINKSSLYLLGLSVGPSLIDTITFTNTNHFTFIAKFDTSGVSQYLFQPSNGGFQIFSQTLGNSGVIVCGDFGDTLEYISNNTVNYLYDTSSTGACLFLFNLDSLLNPVWAQTIQSSGAAIGIASYNNNIGVGGVAGRVSINKYIYFPKQQGLISLMDTSSTPGSGEYPFLAKFTDTTFIPTSVPVIPFKDERKYFILSPNPTSGEITITTTEEKYEIKIIDFYGKKLLSKKLSGSVTLDLSAIRAKTVVVEIYVKGKKVQAEKIVIQ